MISIKSEDIESIYLLSIQQAEKLPRYILAIGDSWWLRSPGTFCGAVEVDENGNVNYFGLKVDYNRGGVRPALKIENLDLLNLEIGETVKALGLMAQYIGDNSVLFCESIAEHRFDSKSNDYEISEVKRFIEEWLKERRPEKKVEMTREEAIEILIKLWNADYEAYLTEEQAEAHMVAVEALQEPKRKKGKWTINEDDDVISGTCSCCGWNAILLETDVTEMSFCPNCGAEMEN